MPIDMFIYVLSLKWCRDQTQWTVGYGDACFLPLILESAVPLVLNQRTNPEHNDMQWPPQWRSVVQPAIQTSIHMLIIPDSKELSLWSCRWARHPRGNLVLEAWSEEAHLRVRHSCRAHSSHSSGADFFVGVQQPVIQLLRYLQYTTITTIGLFRYDEPLLSSHL